MTQETRDIIYNKKAEELNKDEVEFLNQLISKKFLGENFWYVSVFGILGGLLIPLLFSSKFSFLHHEHVVSRDLLILGFHGFVFLRSLENV